MDNQAAMFTAQQMQYNKMYGMDPARRMDELAAAQGSLNPRYGQHPWVDTKYFCDNISNYFLCWQSDWIMQMKTNIEPLFMSFRDNNPFSLCSLSLPPFKITTQVEAFWFYCSHIAGGEGQDSKNWAIFCIFSQFQFPFISPRAPGSVWPEA